jgi:hypothetical protein
MSWFLKWLGDRKNMPLTTLLKDIFSDLVFAQHMRTGLARCDGADQRPFSSSATEGSNPASAPKAAWDRPISRGKNIHPSLLNGNRLWRRFAPKFNLSSHEMPDAARNYPPFGYSVTLPSVAVFPGSQAQCAF